jgi:NADH dehydrogenase FAD-containing subunit
MKKKVVIIGGGFAGTTVARKLQCDGRFDVTLISDRDYFEYTPGILRVLQESDYTDIIRRKFKKFLECCNIVVGNVERVGKKNVHVGGKKYPFDYLAVCSGAGFMEMKGAYGAYRSSDILESLDKLEKAKKILVIGGGLVGVEIVGELIDKGMGKKVTVLQSGDKLVPRNSKKAQDYVEKRFKEAGVKIRYGERLAKFEKGSFVTERGKVLKADVAYVSIGIKSNYGFMEERYKPAIGERGLLVNKYLQVRGEDNVFAAGDVSGIKEEKTAQAASEAGSVIANNIKAKERGMFFRTYKGKKRPMIISLGKRDAVLQWGSFVFGGWWVSFLKDFVERKEMSKVR